ncbi:hypothetical protein GLOTRDRAFT_102259 [Gloeophyllum trabeum ATCC 11539]|uniref:Transcription initiation factor TFIID subunit 1 histone acetyltransferase domain-containing protein n=1 Tax=Gloeophyllum trabeum (strain ATCC 11539 / FP-39264 / Madison 617) TaxID=670483 RepID=S7QPR1_GLOTA|nr:uncharacterized protein GLOTRDRAFT_102259 [Gloeophyllum trabeum ATCC 11539]EPQ61382.1 hypothetical protein GLOTRDRAFT_102259 [Gloeophyllum trabeum ATCC 11539]
MSDENDVDVISTITGYDLDRVLNGYNLPSTSALSSQLGILGIPSLDPRQIYGDKWDDDVVGPDQGEDFEDQVDEELENEEDQADQEMENEESPREASVKVEDEPTESMPKKERRIRVVRRLVERPKSVYERFPTYEKDKILDFTELFKGYTVPRSRVSKRPFQLEPVYPRKRDVPRHFLQSIVGDAERQAENQRADEVIAAGNIDFDLQNALEGRVNTEAPVSLSLQDRSFDLVLLANWEDQIVYEPEEDMEESAIHRRESQAALTTKVNKSLESGAWTQSIIWSPRAPFRDFTQLEVNEEDAAPEERPIADPRPRKRFRSDQVPRDKFNLSNDQYYEVSKEGRGHRVRQTFGQLVVEHAYPAQKLQLPFYKTRLSKQEARSWHRPALQFPSNVEIHFTKVRSAKKKKDKAGRSVGKGGNVSEGLHRTSDLSLKDTSNYVLWEFSEEHPPIMSNFGMGSILVNYYRKKDEKDEHIPKYDLGVPFVLEPQDESPFMKFGYVYPGETVPALYNNLIRAPLFRQKPRPTDFLVIRSTIRGETRYYIREMKNLFVVGQTYPVTEVPGPHSRKITNTIKHRLQNITYKLLSKSHEERLKISRNSWSITDGDLIKASGV